MIVKHVGLVCTSEQRADDFYAGILGLKKHSPKQLAPELSKAIFNVHSELTIINYTGESVVFEVFIAGRTDDAGGRIGHVCLELDDPEAFLSKCRDNDVAIVQVPKGDKIITFVSDDDGNRFEIKGR